MVRLPRAGPVDAEDGERFAEEWRGSLWPVWRYAIVPPGQLLGPLPAAADWEWTQGVFKNVSSLASDPDAPRMYNVAERAPDILRAVLSVSVDQPSSLLAFVNQWGALGVGSGLMGPVLRVVQRPAYDTVWATKRAIRALQGAFAWLRALQARRWASPDMPRLYEHPPSAGATYEDQERASRENPSRYRQAASALLPPPEQARLELRHLHAPAGHDNPYLESFVKAERLTQLARHQGGRPPEEYYWHAFAGAITPHLRAIHPTLGWLDGPTPQWVVPRPVDAAWVELWDWATRGARLRRCRHCSNWFPQERPNKTYCSKVCANRATSARWYRLKGKRLRQQHRPKGRRP